VAVNPDDVVQFPDGGSRSSATDRRRRHDRHRPARRRGRRRRAHPRAAAGAAPAARVRPDAALPGRPEEGGLCEPESHVATFEILRAFAMGGYDEMVTLGPVQDTKTWSTTTVPTLYAIAELRRSVVIGWPDRSLAGKYWRGKLKPTMQASGLGDLLPVEGPGLRRRRARGRAVRDRRAAVPARRRRAQRGRPVDGHRADREARGARLDPRPLGRAALPALRILRRAQAPQLDLDDQARQGVDDRRGLRVVAGAAAVVPVPAVRRGEAPVGRLADPGARPLPLRRDRRPRRRGDRPRRLRARRRAPDPRGPAAVDDRRRRWRLVAAARRCSRTAR
jgi:hypothetical protein